MGVGANLISGAGGGEIFFYFFFSLQSQSPNLQSQEKKEDALPFGVRWGTPAIIVIPSGVPPTLSLKTWDSDSRDYAQPKKETFFQDLGIRTYATMLNKTSRQ